MSWWVDKGTLRNTYYIVRHGRSLANEAGIVVRRPAPDLIFAVKHSRIFASGIAST